MKKFFIHFNCSFNTIVSWSNYKFFFLLFLSWRMKVSVPLLISFTYNVWCKTGKRVLSFNFFSLKVPLPGVMEFITLPNGKCLYCYRTCDNHFSAKYLLLPTLCQTLTNKYLVELSFDICWKFSKFEFRG